MQSLVAARVYRPFSAIKILFAYGIVDTVQVATRMREIAQQGLPGVHMFAMDLLGGRIARVPPDGTAFFPREASFGSVCDYGEEVPVLVHVLLTIGRPWQSPWC